MGLSVLYMVGITVGILYMMSHDTNCGYKKILGLRGDRTGQGRTKTITRSASWRFLALKNKKTKKQKWVCNHEKKSKEMIAGLASCLLHTTIDGAFDSLEVTNSKVCNNAV